MQSEPLPTNTGGAPLNLIPRRVIAEKLGMSVPQLTRTMKKSHDFPKPVELARGAFRWVSGEIDAWVLSRRRLDTQDRAATTNAATAALAEARARNRAKQRARGVVNPNSGTNRQARATA